MKVTLDSIRIEPRIILNQVSWQDYETLLRVFNHRPRLRLSYFQATLEIMTNSPEHEMIKTLIGRLIEIYALEKEIDLYSCGSTTYKKEAEARGLEPDESYCLGSRKEIPDIAIEVIITSGGINKLKIYQGLNVPEVWFWQDGKFRIYQLIDITQGYQEISQSYLLPNLDLAQLSQYVDPTVEPQMVRAYRQAIQCIL